MSKETNKPKLFSLSSLAPSKGSRKTRKRLGRGIGSGYGKTAGRGHKGQKSRSGAKIPAWFEGGAMPTYRRVPKIGFTSIQKITGKNQYNIINLADLDRLFNDGETVDTTSLQSKGYGTNSKNQAGIKVLGTGEISKKLTVKVNAISASAQKKIEAAGGNVELAKVAQPAQA